MNSQTLTAYSMQIAVLGWRQVLNYALLSLLISAAFSGCGGGNRGVPVAPVGLSAGITAPGEITLTWEAVAGADSYSVYVADRSGVSRRSTLLAFTTTAPRFIHSGLIKGNSYFYVVTASNGYGESSESAEVHALVDVPRAPTAISAVAKDGAVTLSWDNATSTTYNVYLSSQSGVSSANYATFADGMALRGVSSPYTVTGLTNGTTYHLVLTGVNGYGESADSGELMVTPAATGVSSVGGIVRYEDKEYSLTGFTSNNIYRAVRFATVEVVDAVSGTVLVTGATDASGAYQLDIPPGQGGKSLYVRALSAAASPAINVSDLTNALFAVPGPAFGMNGAVTAHISIPVTNAADGAFNILDVLASGAQFLQSLTGSYPPQLNAYWQQGNARGTYFCSKVPDPYCPQGVGIYVLNDGVDTDEFDDDVVWHEYGHFAAYVHSKDDSPGGVHGVATNDQDLRLSWSEGWGDFFPGAIKSWLPLSMLSAMPALTRTTYIDTSGTSASSFDFAAPPAGPSYYYSSSEAAVAKVLHDLRVTHGTQAVWNVFTSTQIIKATTPVNLEVFRDGWTLLGNPDMTSILVARSINYSADGYEPGDSNFNSLRLQGVGQAESHTLYDATDVDYIAFNATQGLQYTVKTTSLRNGADTVIRVFSPDQTTIVASNDNSSGLNFANTVPYNLDRVTGEYHENGADILGSSASFSATVGGVYFVEVKSSPQRPLSAGRYGNYLLSISSP